MVDDFKGPDGVDYSPIDLYAQYSVTPEQVRKMVQQTIVSKQEFLVSTSPIDSIARSLVSV